MDEGVIRTLGGLEFDVVVDENETSEVEITDHPVESGALISDHAYAMPREVELHIGHGVTDSEDDPVDMLHRLRDIQAAREPVELTTGKGYYPAMVITAIEVMTDRTTENVLSATVRCREVVIVATATADVPAVRQQHAKKTMRATNKGTVQAKPQEDDGGGGKNKKQSFLKSILD